MFLGLNLVLYILRYLFIVYITLFRLIVLYSQCRVNRGTNLSVVLYNAITFCFASTAHLGLCVGRSQLVGRSPLCFSPLHNTMGLGKSLDLH